MQQTIRDLIKALPFVAAFLNTDSFRTVRHKMVLRRDRKRDGSITFTRFIRLPTQFEALSGPVLEFVGGCSKTEPLRIVVLGCSNGAEAYSVASILSTTHPGLQFEIRAGDFNSEMVKVAESGCYTRDNVYDNKIMRDEFVSRTFEIAGESFCIKPEIRRHVKFDTLDAFDPGLAHKIGQFDIIFAQNFLFNHSRPKAALLFNNILTLAKPRSVLFLEGMDYDMRAGLTRLCGFRPLDFKIEEIHNDALSERAVGWPYTYWGLEPFSRLHLAWKRRYATIFIRGQ